MAARPMASGPRATSRGFGPARPRRPGALSRVGLPGSGLAGSGLSGTGLGLAGWAMVAAAAYYWLLLLDNILIRTDKGQSGYLDEIFVLLASPWAAAALIHPPRGLLPVLLGFGGFLAAGIASGLFSSVPGYPFAAAASLTAALDAKPFILLLAFAFCLRGAKGSEVMMPFLVSLIAIALVHVPFMLRDLLLANGYSIFGEEMDLRAGMFRPHGLYHHPAAGADITLLATMAAGVLWSIRKTPGPALLCGFLAVCTMMHLVAKEMAAAVLVVGLAILAMRFRNPNTQFLVRAAAVVLAIVLAVPFADLALPIIEGQVAQYVVEDAESAVRSLMYMISVQLAAANFPLGTGLGTFGSLASYTLFYSPIYDQTGLANIFGASRNYPYFLQDVYWPKVLGEAGWAGLACFLALVLYLTVRVTASAMRRPTMETLFASMVLITALVKSVAAPTFTSDLYVMALGVAMAIAACHPQGFGYRPPPADGAARPAAMAPWRQRGPAPRPRRP